jgi:hypothetical protein
MISFFNTIFTNYRYSELTKESSLRVLLNDITIILLVSNYRDIIISF